MLAPGLPPHCFAAMSVLPQYRVTLERMPDAARCPSLAFSVAVSATEPWRAGSYWAGAGSGRVLRLPDDTPSGWIILGGFMITVGSQSQH
jgi:hypothetical protein